MPFEAIEIRNEVFVEEQGFKEEFDSFDETATHIVGFINSKSVATSRIIQNLDGSFLIGRIAVRKDYRKKGLGAEIIEFSEKLIKEKGGKIIYIHAQLQAKGFYEKLGYFPFGDEDEDEGCPHQMMKKVL